MLTAYSAGRRFLLLLAGIGTLLFSTSVRANGGTVTLAWNLSWEQGIAGYHLHYGTESGEYTHVVNVGYQFITQIEGLHSGETYYFAITAYDADGLESDFSEEVVHQVDPPESTDTDGDGLSNYYEERYGASGSVDPQSDDDGDGLTALAEYYHGLDPTKPLRRQLPEVERMEVSSEAYLCVRYLIDPNARDFVDLRIERSTDLSDPDGWHEVQLHLISEQPAAEEPGLIEVLARSHEPMSANRLEVIRFRHVPK